MASEKSKKEHIFIPMLLFLFFFLGSFSYSSTPSAEEAKKEKDTEKKFGYIVLPVLYYTPETKMAAGVGTLFYFRPSTDPKSRPSDIKTIIIYTQRKQFVFGTSPDFYLKKEKYHLMIDTAFSKFPDKFYGVGSQTAEEMEEDYTSQVSQFNISLQKKVLQKMYVGLIYAFEHNRIVKKEEGKLLAKKELLGSEGGASSGFGFLLNWDSRDSVYYPTSGSLHKFSIILFQSILGSDFEFTEFNLDLRKYVSFFSRHILALQAYLNFISGNPPFQMMSLFGGQEMMRGYYQGRYRDKQMMAFQMEYRLPALWRIGLVGFAGWGDVADKINHFDFSNLKYSLGWGIRFALNREESINLRLDFGYGKRSSGVYFTAGEAF